ncbi:MAG: outer membrane beta-barrel protein [Bacteroidetes bacterium]|nr:outer membrane beta-barrel protein [Bacteroidota bacterium]
MGFSYGLTFDYKLGKTFMFTTGFDVTNINSKSIITKNINFINPNYNKTATTIDSNYTFTSANTAYSNKLKYLEIPLMFSGRTKEIGYMTYFFQAGFTPSFLLSQKSYITPSNPNVKLDGKVLLNSTATDDYVTKQDDISLVRMGFVLGAGAEYNLQGTTSLVGSVRFSNGLFNIMKDPNSEFQKVKNNYISLNVGIVF